MLQNLYICGCKNDPNYRFLISLLLMIAKDRRWRSSRVIEHLTDCPNKFILQLSFPFDARDN